MKTPTIYVIIVTYNGLRWVDACFGSLRRSTVPLHTVVVDNRSTDGTPEAIAERFPEVHLIRSAENLGFGRGNNIGIRYAREQGADYYFLLNQDAWIFPQTLSRLLAAEKPGDGVLSPVHLDGTAERMDRMFRGYLFPDRKEDDRTLLAGFTAPCEAKFVNAAAWLLPAYTVESVGGFDPLFSHYGEDNNYVHRLHFHGFKVRVVPGSFICHDRQNGGNPLRTAWVGRYLTIVYADPRRSVWSATLHTLGRQLNLLARIPAYRLLNRKAEAKAITDAYRACFRRWRSITESRLKNRQKGPSWL